MTIVVNKREQKFDVYIGRGSIWGNPFKMASEADRKRVIIEYEKWLRSKPELLKQLHELKGKRLGCFCKPKACHGDVLVGFVEQMNDDGCFGYYEECNEECDKCRVSDECFSTGVV